MTAAGEADSPHLQEFLHVAHTSFVDAGDTRRLLDAVFAQQLLDRGVSPPDELLVEIEIPRGLPVETLGRLHEQSLTRGHRKRRGVYYTPAWIAEYIAEGNVPPSGRVIDPACGSGAILVASYRRMVAGIADPETRRTTALERIFGIDRDSVAARVCRHTIALVALEHGGTLFDLRQNIVAGDALVGFEFEGRFAPGFTAVVGNPPYIRERSAKATFDEVAASPLGRFRTSRMDYWFYFVHRAIELLAPGGKLGFIVPSYFTKGAGSTKLIAALRESTAVREIFMLDDAEVFDGVVGRHLILSVVKATATEPATILRVPVGAPSAEPYVRGVQATLRFERGHRDLFARGGVDLEPPDPVADRIDAHPSTSPLGSLGLLRQGIAENPARMNRRTIERFGGGWRAGEGVFCLSADELDALDLPVSERAIIRPYHLLRDLGRHRLAPPSSYLIFATPKTWPLLDAHPALARHLSRFRAVMEARRESQSGHLAWWHLHWPRDESLWAGPKIIAVQLARRPSFSFAPDRVMVPFSANVFVPSPAVGEHPAYLTGILASTPMARWFERRAKRRGAGLDLGQRVLASVPIRRIDFGDRGERLAHDRVVDLVQQMHREASESADSEIDEIVRGLYAVP